MPKYLFHVNYLEDGIKGLLEDGGSKRRAAVENLLPHTGPAWTPTIAPSATPTYISFAEFPNPAAAAACVLTVTATGTVTVKTTVLPTPEEIDAAAKLQPTYAGPPLPASPGCRCRDNPRPEWGAKSESPAGDGPRERRGLA